jgi:uncharacterized protein YfiM (DUF2279 family)
MSSNRFAARTGIIIRPVRQIQIFAAFLHVAGDQPRHRRDVRIPRPARFAGMTIVTRRAASRRLAAAARLLAIKSLMTGGFVRGGFVSCNKVKPAASATKNHFNFLFKRLLASSFQRLDIRNQSSNLCWLKFSGERRHFARFAFADSVGNPVVSQTKIVQVRSIVTMCACTMTMSAIF